MFESNSRKVSATHLIDDAFGNELVLVQYQGVFLLLDDLVHQRVCEHGLIDLVVPVLSVADDVNDNI